MTMNELCQEKHVLIKLFDVHWLLLVLVAPCDEAHHIHKASFKWCDDVYCCCMIKKYVKLIQVYTPTPPFEFKCVMGSITLMLTLGIAHSDHWVGNAVWISLLWPLCRNFYGTILPVTSPNTKDMRRKNKTKTKDRISSDQIGPFVFSWCHQRPKVNQEWATVIILQSHPCTKKFIHPKQISSKAKTLKKNHNIHAWLFKYTRSFKDLWVLHTFPEELLCNSGSVKQEQDPSV